MVVSDLGLSVVLVAYVFLSTSSGPVVVPLWHYFPTIVASVVNAARKEFARKRPPILMPSTVESHVPIVVARLLVRVLQKAPTLCLLLACFALYSAALCNRRHGLQEELKRVGT